MCKTRDLGSIPELGRSSGEGIGYPLQCSWSSLVAQLVKNPQCRRPWFDFWAGKILWRRNRLPTPVFLGFPGGSDGKESTCIVGDLGSVPGVGKIPWRRAWKPTPLFLPAESSWTEEPGGLQSMGCKESDTTERLTTKHLKKYLRVDSHTTL